jgi:rod shape determining protein RodA
MKELKSIDPYLLFGYLLLVMIGWLSIFSASSEAGAGFQLDMANNGGKQLIWIGLSLFVGAMVLLSDRKIYVGFAWYIYIFAMILLVAVLIVGKEIAGSRSWFQIGSFRLQPSEFGKLATALAVSAFINQIGVVLRNTRTLILVCMVFMLPAGLIVLQGDAGSALVYVAFFIVLYREGMNKWIMIVALLAIFLTVCTLMFGAMVVIVGVGILVAVVIAFNYTNRGAIYMALGIFILCGLYAGGVGFAFDHVLRPHQQNRILVTLNLLEDPRGVGYNVNQSKIAIGSGGLTGAGFLNGTQNKGDFVPEQSTDFIFCTVGEEWGWLGSSFLIILYLFVIWRCFMVAERQKKRFNRVYGYSVGSILFMHFMINIGMTIGLMPVVGIPLPFMSYGGSSLIAFTILLFILIRLDAGRETEYISIKDFY